MISVIKQKIEAIIDTINTIKSQYQINSKKISALSEENKKLYKHIIRLEKICSDNERHIKSLKSKISSLDQKIQTNEQKIVNIDSRLKTR